MHFTQNIYLKDITRQEKLQKNNLLYMLFYSTLCDYVVTQK